MTNKQFDSLAPGDLVFIPNFTKEIIPGYYIVQEVGFGTEEITLHKSYSKVFSDIKKFYKVSWLAQETILCCRG
jgi:hypothetical protein